MKKAEEEKAGEGKAKEGEEKEKPEGEKEKKEKEEKKEATIEAGLKAAKAGAKQAKHVSTGKQVRIQRKALAK